MWYTLNNYCWCTSFYWLTSIKYCILYIQSRSFCLREESLLMLLTKNCWFSKSWLPSTNDDSICSWWNIWVKVESVFFLLRTCLIISSWGPSNSSVFIQTLILSMGGAGELCGFTSSTPLTDACTSSCLYLPLHCLILSCVNVSQTYQWDLCRGILQRRHFHRSLFILIICNPPPIIISPHGLTVGLWTDPGICC